MTALIAAYTPDRVIGYKGRIPWYIEGEQKRFRELTTGNIVIMGRRTFDEIKKKLGGPLPDRITILISTTTVEKERENQLYIARSFEQAMGLAEQLSEQSSNQMLNRLSDASSNKLPPKKNIYIAGGTTLYRKAVDIVDVIYITEVDISVEGDTFFPEFDESLFDKKIEEYHPGDTPYTYVTYIRK